MYDMVTSSKDQLLYYLTGRVCLDLLMGSSEVMPLVRLRLLVQETYSEGKNSYIILK